MLRVEQSVPEYSVRSIVFLKHCTNWDSVRSAVTNWDSIRSAVTNWDSVRSAVTNWDSVRSAVTNWGSVRSAVTNWGSVHSAVTNWGSVRSAVRSFTWSTILMSADLLVAFELLVRSIVGMFLPLFA